MKRVMKSDHRRRAMLALKAISKLLPKAMVNDELNSMLKALSRSKATPIHSEATQQYPQIFEALVEIRKLTFSTISFLIYLGIVGPEIVFCQFALYLVSHALVDESNRIEECLANGTICFLCLTFQKNKMAIQLFDECNQIFTREEFEDGLTIEGKQPAQIFPPNPTNRLLPSGYRSSILCFNYVLLNFTMGNIADCITPCHRFLELGGSSYSSSVHATHVTRLKLIFIETALGHVQTSVAGILRALKEVYSESITAIEGKDLYLLLANHYVSLGNLEAAFHLYDENAAAIEEYMANYENGKSMESFYRVLASSEADGDNNHRLFTRTFDIIVRSLELMQQAHVGHFFFFHLTGIKVPLLVVPMVTIFPTLVDLAMAEYVIPGYDARFLDLKQQLKRAIVSLTSRIAKLHGFLLYIKFNKLIRRALMYLQKGKRSFHMAHRQLVEFAKLSEQGQFPFVQSHSRHRIVARIAVLEVEMRRLGISKFGEFGMRRFKESYEELVAVGMEKEANMITRGEMMMG
ncbi:hypothetical protein HDU97_009929 [Phlyctochytrium planicorne]|nr:hypothetical protein HDU97_009929 [Phlyctochytrium planicorne]